MEQITSEVKDFHAGHIMTAKYIKDNTGFTLSMIGKMVTAASTLSDITVTYDPDNPDQCKTFNYDQNSPVQQKVTIRIQRTNFTKDGMFVFLAEVKHYSNSV